MTIKAATVCCNDNQSQKFIAMTIEAYLCITYQQFIAMTIKDQKFIAMQITDYWSGKPMPMFKLRGEQKGDKPGNENLVKAKLKHFFKLIFSCQP